MTKRQAPMKEGAYQLRALTDCMAHTHTGSVCTDESSRSGNLEKRRGMYLLYCK